MPETSSEDCELEAIRAEEEVVADRGPAVRFQEYHEESKTDENHNVYVLPHWVELPNFLCGREFTRCEVDVRLA